MAKLKLDLHDIYNKGHLIDKALNEAVQECVDNRIKELEIIPGKGSGQLKKKVLRFLNQKYIKNKYHRIDKDSKNFGRLFVHFKF
jgi:dsDNA-specific endonuclease/ATPase MutS2